ncbi:FAD-binding oxidoreductase [Marmoricola sp. URHB0036]|uniref:FAD-binding oxidoreductase n=1 Tax=Marmoricola sp. URHB0036 TaxID=1298863 RepID=UPI0009DB9E57|nr:FAD-binding oxidoreductase [Marmoricola sp. URHB0036]
MSDLQADRFGGQMIEPGHADYEVARRTVFATGAPAYVVRPDDVGDVRAAVRFARDAALPLSIRGGGHSFSGFGTNDGGLVIDLGGLDSVRILDLDRRLVRIGGGATWGTVAAALSEHNLAISSGDTRSVGVGGLTLAGGIGWKVRKYGLALDALVGAEVVLASGEVVHASAEDHSDLFWALRGGGGSFGVVTAFDFAAHTTTEVFHGKVTFPAREAETVLTGWSDYLRAAPDDLTSLVNLANPMTGGPQAPVEVHVTFDSDDADRAAEALEPIRRLGTVLDDDITLRPYADTLVDGAAPPPGLQFVLRSAFVDEESVPDVLRVLAESSTSNGAPVVGVRSLGGAVSRVPEGATAYPYRQAELLVVSVTAGPAPVVEAARPALDAMWSRLGPSVHGAYANFLSTAGEEALAAVYPAATHERLAQVKRCYDPANLFSRNHNVRPASPTDAHPHPGRDADSPYESAAEAWASSPSTNASTPGR